jgi:hypothetical protein
MISSYAVQLISNLLMEALLSKQAAEDESCSHPPVPALPVLSERSNIIYRTSVSLLAPWSLSLPVHRLATLFLPESDFWMPMDNGKRDEQQEYKDIYENVLGIP